MLSRLFLPILIVLTSCAIGRAQGPSPLTVSVSLDAKLTQDAVAGRLFIVLTRHEPQPIVPGFDWFHPEPTFAIDVKHWKPGTEQTLDARAKAFPTAMKDLASGRYYLQAILDRDLGSIHIFTAKGNYYSKASRITVDAAKPQVLKLVLDQVFEPEPVMETNGFKHIEIPSKLLTDFHKKPMTLKAGVVLPPSFAKDATKKYPLVIDVPGFGGTSEQSGIYAALNAWNLAGTECIWIIPDPNCRNGHHVFANSDNNGPYGDALVKELIPHLEATFRGLGTPAGRLVTGHSSGGWSSLWLQITYPDYFGGCWSTAPDPVDFRDFQGNNLYEPNQNLFADVAGKLRPLSRGDRGSVLTFKQFSAMEDVMGHGGQLGSFEAVFSPKQADGTPRKMWDRATGAIDGETVKAWQKYDIRRVMEENWKTLGPKLAGKVHVWMGDRDTFLLDGACRLLKESQAKLGSDAVIEMIPGKDHNLLDVKWKKRMSTEMAATVNKGAK